jgi:hypothetical protein
MRLERTAHARFGTALVLLLFSPSGCVMALGSGMLPSHIVVTQTSPATQAVAIDSEPANARITENGVILGTTPTTVKLTYDNAEREKRLKHCWAMLPLGLTDLALGGAGVWGSHLGYEKTHDPWGVIGMIAASLYGGLALTAALSEIATGCRISGESPGVVVHNHRVQLDYRGFRESLAIEVPVGSSSSGDARVSAKFSALDAADWSRAEALGTKAAFTRYLDDHPAGNRRKDAMDYIEASDWLAARQQDSATAYRQYMVEHPAGRRREEAETRIEALDWLAARQQDSAIAYRQYMVEHPAGRQREEARTRMEEVAWQEAREQNTDAAYAKYLEHCSPRCREEARDRLLQAARRQDTVFAYMQYVDHCSPKCNNDASSRLLQLREKEKNSPWEKSILAWWKSGPGHAVPEIPVDSLATVVPALRAAGAPVKDVVGMAAEVMGRDRHVVGMAGYDSFPDWLRALHQAGATTKDLSSIITRNMRSVSGGTSLLIFGKAKIAVWARWEKRSIVLDDHWASALAGAGFGERDIAELNAALLASGAGTSPDEVRRMVPGFR